MPHLHQLLHDPIFELFRWIPRACRDSENLVQMQLRGIETNGVVVWRGEAESADLSPVPDQEVVNRAVRYLGDEV